MMKEIDPVYGHIVGPFPCEKEGCKGHRTKSGATIHRLYIPKVGKKKEEAKMQQRLVGESVTLPPEENKKEDVMTKKELKAKAREAGVRCFNLMTVDELKEATASALSGNIARLEELQNAARSRFKKPVPKS